jgi:hypothetical protein
MSHLYYSGLRTRLRSRDEGSSCCPRFQPEGRLLPRPHWVLGLRTPHIGHLKDCAQRPHDTMTSRCCELVDSRLRLFPATSITATRFKFNYVPSLMRIASLLGSSNDVIA